MDKRGEVPPFFYLSPSPSPIREATQLSAQITKLAQSGEIFILCPSKRFVVIFLLDLLDYLSYTALSVQ